MQVERGKTRPNTMMTGHTGYITHARKIIKPTTEQPAAEAVGTENEILEDQEIVVEELADDIA
jgi:hypothetical protein